MKDNENNPITVDYTPKLNWINLINNTLIFNPVSASDFGNHIINITISDGQPLSNYQTFNFLVYNIAPSWNNSKLSDVKIKMNDFLTVQLPNTYNPT